jgi:photosystem II stability/assembly factor-like uncharacterized protein
MPRLAALLALLAMASSEARELTDVLDLPAEHTEFALQSTMVDVALAGDRLVAVGDYGSVLCSDDGGASWWQAEVPVQVTLTAVDFVDAEYGWAVGHDAVVLHTQDGGASWLRQLDGRQTGPILLEGATAWEESVQARLDDLEQGSDAEEDFAEGGDAEEGFAEGGDAEEDLLTELDAAQMAVAEAERETEDGPSRPLLDVLFLDRQHGYVVGAFGYFFETMDGGQTWRDVSSRVRNFESLNLYSIARLGESSLLLVGEFGFALRSDDRGASWQPLELDYDGTLFTTFARGSDAWIAGLRGTVFFSSDEGRNWQFIENESEASLMGGQVLEGPRAVFVGQGGSVLEVDGLSGEVVQHPTGSRATFGSVAIAPNRDRVLVGETGVIRMNAQGELLPVSYVERDAP